MPKTHTTACFVRVDLEVPGRPTAALHAGLGEHLQDLLKDAVLSPPLKYELLGMTCRVVGPIDRADRLTHGDDANEYAPLLEVLGQEQRRGSKANPRTSKAKRGSKPEKRKTKGPRVLSVLGRWDFVVTDKDAVMRAGRAAYSRLWPNTSRDDAEEEVRDVAAAANAIMHAVDLPALKETPGLSITQATVTFIRHRDTSDFADNAFRILKDCGA